MAAGLKHKKGRLREGGRGRAGRQGQFPKFKNWFASFRAKELTRIRCLRVV
jgi:hypothetical protein